MQISEFLNYITIIFITLEMAAVNDDARKCDKIKNFLCNVCGLYTPIQKQRPFTKLIVEKYKELFKTDPKVDDDFAPDHLCITCNTMLVDTKRKRLLPTVPMIWIAPDVAHLYCNSCLMPSLVGKKWCDRKKKFSILALRRHSFLSMVL